MSLRTPYNARRYNTLVVLTYSEAVVDEFGHASMGEPVDVCRTYAYVRQMSASKTMMTFQQADVVGLEIELRNPNVRFNGLYWNGHHVQFSQPEEVERGRILRINGYYQTDNPRMQ
jgi:hypothetical protein